MMKVKTPVTIKDLARELNLSVSTVSYALNNGPRPVSQEVKDRVAAVADRLDYRPSRIARTLVTGQTHTLGIVIPAPDTDTLLAPFHHVTITGFATALEEFGYDMLMYTRPERMKKETLVQSFTDGRTDGLVVSNPVLDEDVIFALDRMRFPFALVSRRLPISVPQFVSDNASGIRQALEHLWELGHRKIGYLHGEIRQFDARERLEAYQAFMREHGREPIISFGSFDPEITRRAAAAMLLQSRPTAILASHDESAQGIYSAAQELGLCIPRDLSVVGYDDMPVAALQTPPLTTIRQPIYQMATDAIRAVIGFLHEGRRANPGTYPVELVIRGSTGPAPR